MQFQTDKLEGLSENEAVTSRSSGKSHRRQYSLGNSNTSLRLLLVSNKVKNSLTLQTAVLPNVVILQYRHDFETLDHLLCKWLSYAACFIYFLANSCKYELFNKVVA